jgi:hypothetical protein
MRMARGMRSVHPRTCGEHTYRNGLFHKEKYRRGKSTEILLLKPALSLE